MSTKESRAAYMREWYRENKEKVKGWAARWQANNPDKRRAIVARASRAYRASHPGKAAARQAAVRAVVRQMKVIAKERGCAKCGSLKRLHFHHRDPSTKLFAVGVGAGQQTPAAVAAEIAKSDVLCHDCHWNTHRAMKAQAKV